MTFAGFPKETSAFLRGLKRNNRREWFQPRKHLFEQHVKGPMLELVEGLNSEFAKFAPQYVTDPKKAIFRIYRDTRFSPDKTPYKTHIAASFRRRGGEHMAVSGFYFSVSSDQIEIAGGIYHPAPDTTLLVRTHIAGNYDELRRILADKALRRYMGALQGDELTRAPKGFDPGHPAIDLIKKKDWILDTEIDSSLVSSYAATSSRDRHSLSCHDAADRILEPSVACRQAVQEAARLSVLKQSGFDRRPRLFRQLRPNQIVRLANHTL